MDLLFEKSLIPARLSPVCGLDEAGRGPLAGPVFAGAVILPEGYVPEGLNDSKKLSEKKREALFEEITKNAVAWAFGTASPEEIDEINILNASMLAMRRAVEALYLPPAFLLVDGNVVRGFEQPAVSVIKGDAKCPSIAAASIIAKVLRDRDCLRLDKEYPGYGFAAHKGYPTKAHFAAIEANGVLPIHRKSFLVKRGLA
ncbi:MAG: ribonuclease HII [Clostridia bacterium]|nr:ribonuclease HII [Clostridia bacterium]